VKDPKISPSIVSIARRVHFGSQILDKRVDIDDPSRTKEYFSHKLSSEMTYGKNARNLLRRDGNKTCGQTDVSLAFVPKISKG